MTPPRRIDWLRIAVWITLGMAACLLANVLGWIVQRGIMVAWPVASAHPRQVLAVVAVAVCGGWAISRGRR